MAEKDITEKLLEDYPDVFADIVNVLIYNGEDIVKADDLEMAGTLSQYKAANTIHSQDRDVAKYWTKGQVRICFLGLENQSVRDPDIALRVIGYDGAAYRDELKHGDARYPVVTLVLYFGTDHRWGQKSRSLYSVIGVPDKDKELGRFIHDYKANIFEIAWLDDETVAKFKSDFRIVADYFVQMRKNHNYVPSAEDMQHVEEVLNLLAAVSGDRRFEITQNEVEERKVTKMEDWLTRALDKATEKGIEKGIEDGIKKGRKTGIEGGMAEKLVKCVDSLMKNEGFSKERACSVLDSSVEEYEAAKRLLAEMTVPV
ncbi:MAG: Rpn family recombination-promoting nuclease/putative transposase [Lachnospiraceae bacterium]|nr:Rpn family recombination-promoting nuclease/putative transposase [Lachnospiraceae bacterium]